MADDRTLTEILTSLGYTHRPSERFAGQRDVIDASGRLVITGTAQGVTTWLRQMGKLPAKDASPAPFKEGETLVYLGPDTFTEDDYGQEMWARKGDLARVGAVYPNGSFRMAFPTGADPHFETFEANLFRRATQASKPAKSKRRAGDFSQQIRDAPTVEARGRRLPSGGYDYQSVKLELRHAGRLVDAGKVAEADAVIRNLAGSATPNDVSNVLTRAQLAKLRKHTKAKAKASKPAKTKRSALGIKATGQTKIKGAENNEWSASPAEVYVTPNHPGTNSVMDSRKATGQWRVLRSTTRDERGAGVEYREVIITKNKTGYLPSGAQVEKGRVDLWEFGPLRRLRGSPRIADWKGTAAQLLKHYDRIEAKKLGIPEPGTSKKKAKAVSKKTTKKKATKKKATKKKRRPLEDGEARLLKAPGDLIAMYAGKYKLTAAMEAVRRASRTGAAIKCRTVITAYDQLKRRAKAPGKSPGQSLAYYVTAELAKALAHSPYFVATGKGDHPRIKPE